MLVLAQRQRRKRKGHQETFRKCAEVTDAFHKGSAGGLVRLKNKLQMLPACKKQGPALLPFPLGILFCFSDLWCPLSATSMGKAV